MSFRPLSSSGLDKRYDVHFNTCRKVNGAIQTYTKA